MEALERQPNFRKVSSLLAPLATTDDNGGIRWGAKMAMHVVALAPGGESAGRS